MSELPFMQGITGYFDVSSLDLDNGKWINNLAGGVDMTLTGGTLSDGALMLASGQYGLCSCGEPDVIYALLKKPANDNDRCLFSRARNSNSSGYDLSLWSETTAGANMLFGCMSAPYVNLNVSAEYHVLATAYMSSVNTAKTNMALIYVDGKLIGIRPNVYRGQAYGIAINAHKAGADVSYICTSATYFKAVACGSNTNSDIIYQNSMYLLEGGAQPEELTAGGTKPIAYAYIMALNKERTDASVREAQLYREGIINNTINPGSTEPWQPETPPGTIDIVPNNPGEDTIPPYAVEPAIIDLGSGGMYLKYANPNDPEDYIIVKIYLDDYFYENRSRYGYLIRKYHVCADIYDESGQKVGDTKYLTDNAGEHFPWIYRFDRTPPNSTQGEYVVKLTIHTAGRYAIPTTWNYGWDGEPDRYQKYTWRTCKLYWADDTHTQLVAASNNPIN